MKAIIKAESGKTTILFPFPKFVYYTLGFGVIFFGVFAFVSYLKGMPLAPILICLGFSIVEGLGLFMVCTNKLEVVLTSTGIFIRNTIFFINRDKEIDWKNFTKAEIKYNILRYNIKQYYIVLVAGGKNVKIPRFASPFREQAEEVQKAIQDFAQNKGFAKMQTTEVLPTSKVTLGNSPKESVSGMVWKYVLVTISALVLFFFLALWKPQWFPFIFEEDPEQTMQRELEQQQEYEQMARENIDAHTANVLTDFNASLDGQLFKSLEFSDNRFIVSRIPATAGAISSENTQGTCSLSRIYHEKVPVTFTIVEEVPAGDPALNGTKLHAQTTIERNGSTKETFGYDLGLDVYRVLAAANTNNGFEILVAEHQGFEDTGEVIGKFILYSMTLDLGIPEITLSQEYESRNMTSEEMENFISSLWPGSNCEIVNANEIISYAT